MPQHTSCVKTHPTLCVLASLSAYQRLALSSTVVRFGTKGNHLADFDPYVANLHNMPKGPTEFAVLLTAQTQHNWCDLAEHYRGRRRTNTGAQPAEVCAYVVGEIDVPAAGRYRLHVAFDDWMTLWLNGSPIFTKRHDHGFAEEAVPVSLPSGKQQIRIKLSNHDNFQWRLWTFNLRLEPMKE